MFAQIKSWLGRKDRGTRTGRKRRAVRLGMEVLEGREVPAALNIVGGVLTYTAGNNVANFLNVSFDPASNRYTVTDRETIDLQAGVLDGDGDLTTTVSFSAANVAALSLSTGNLPDTVNVMSTADSTTVYAGDGDDTVNLGSYVVNTTYVEGYLNDIRAPVTVHGQGGSYDQLWVNDWYNDRPTTYTVTNSWVGRSVAGVQPVGITYGNTVEMMRLNENQGPGTVNVLSTSAATAVHISLKAGGADTVNVGSNYSLDTIRGPVSVAGQVGGDGTAYDTLNINDQFDGDAQTYTIATGTVSRSGAGLITYGGGLAALNVNAGLGADTIYVQSTAALAPVTVNAGGGNDTIRVGRDASVGSIRGPLAVNGGGGHDRLVIDDSANGPDAFFIDLGCVKRNGVNLLAHAGIELFEIRP